MNMRAARTFSRSSPSLDRRLGSRGTAPKDKIRENVSTAQESEAVAQPGWVTSATASMLHAHTSMWTKSERL
jgi:hypothetical protein